MLQLFHGHPGSRLRGMQRAACRVAAAIGVVALLSFPATAGVTAVVQSETGCGIRPLDVVIVIDRSGSMASVATASGVPPQVRMVYAKVAANQLIDALNANGGVGGSNRHMVGLSSYGNGSATVNVQLGSAASAATVTSAVDGLVASGNTPFKQGMAAGQGDVLAGDRATFDGLEVGQVLIFLSDGKPNPDPGSRPSAAEIAAFKGAADEVFSIAVGEGGTGAFGVDLPLMEALASPNDGSHFSHVTDGDELPDIFAQIFDEIACNPDIEIGKSPDTTTLPAGGGPVTYTYAVTNPGNVTLVDVAVTDDMCSPVTYDSGDTDGDARLDLGETWLFRCAATLTTTTTNVATATGWFGDLKVEDDDSATVTVAAPTPVPSVEPTPAPTPVPSVEPTPAPTAPPSASPTGGVAAETGTPSVTPPPTDAGAPRASMRDALSLALAALAVAATLAMAATTRRGRTG